MKSNPLQCAVFAIEVFIVMMVGIAIANIILALEVLL
jgi:hypothetical protein